MGFDFDILYWIQGLHTDFLDKAILLLTNAVGSYCQLWVVIGAVLCVFKKTRKSGIAVLLSYALVYLTGQYVLKDLIARTRPCVIDQTVELLVKRPTSYSCPSTHTAWSFGAATAIFMNHKKAGIGAFVAAAVIGFSRLYLFVHFPTDVLAGIALGILAGVAAVYLVRFGDRKITAAKECKALEAKPEE